MLKWLPEWFWPEIRERHGHDDGSGQRCGEGLVDILKLWNLLNLIPQ